MEHPIESALRLEAERALYAAEEAERLAAISGGRDEVLRRSLLAHLRQEVLERDAAITSLREALRLSESADSARAFSNYETRQLLGLRAARRRVEGYVEEPPLGAVPDLPATDAFLRAVASINAAEEGLAERHSPASQAGSRTPA